MKRSLIDCMKYCSEWNSSVEYVEYLLDDTFIKQVKPVAPHLKREDMVLIGRSEYGSEGFKNGVIFTKDTIYVPETKPISLYGIKDLIIVKKTKGVFKKTSYMDVTVVYESEKIHFTMEGSCAQGVMDVFKYLYPCGQDPVTPPYDEVIGMAKQALQNGDKDKYVELLDGIAEYSGDAAGELIRYYSGDRNYEMAEKYTEMAKKLHHPYPYYSKYYSLLLRGQDEEAFHQLMKAFECGQKGLEQQIITLRQKLREKNRVLSTRPYRYNSMDIDPFMIDCIHNFSLQMDYESYLESRGVDKAAIDSWSDAHRTKWKTEMDAEDVQFSNYLIKTFNTHSSIEFKYYNSQDFEKEFCGGLWFNIVPISNNIQGYFLGNDKIIISKLPSLTVDNYRLNELGIKSILDEFGYVMQRRWLVKGNMAVGTYNEEAEGILIALDDALKGKKVLTAEFLEDNIISYERVMRTQKRKTNLWLAVLHLLCASMTSSDYQLFDFEEYYKLSVDRVLKYDERFLTFRDQCLQKLRLSENDLFKKERSYDDVWMAQRMKHGCEKLLNHKDHLHNFAFFYPYACQADHDLDYRVKEFVKNLKKGKNIDLDMESILMYESLSTASSSGYVLTCDHIYSNFLEKGIRLDGLIGIYPKNQKLIAAVYEDMHEEVIEHSHSHISGLEEQVFHSINCMMIYR